VSALLEVRGLQVDRGEIPVLHDIDLEIGEEELCVLTGPNGAGKSTLVECLVGTIPPRSGQILFDGDLLDGVGTAGRVRRGLAFVPEGRRLFPSLTVRENLRVAAHAWGVDSSAVDRFLELLHDEFPSLGDRLDVPAGSLSGGQQQMLAIARALLPGPRMIVLDEPSFGLSPGAWADVVARCRALARHGTAVLLVEQRVLDVLGVADSAYLLRSGRAHRVDPNRHLTDPDELLTEYFGPGDR
jgi:branched-chain amino acid transport system ATP-binding protein